MTTAVAATPLPAAGVPAPRLVQEWEVRQPSPPRRPPPSPEWTVEDLARVVPGVPLSRIRFDIPPGTATEQDVLDILHHEDRHCELVDGVLVEKPMGQREAELATYLVRQLGPAFDAMKGGGLTGSDGLFRTRPRRVRQPDASFISRARRSGMRRQDNITPVAPDLAVEVLSESNTAAEMRQKRAEYFAGGTRLLWIIDPDTRTVTAWTGPESSRELGSDDVLDGGEVLPGAKVPVRDLWAEWDRIVAETADQADPPTTG